jgi:hypothetical protein
MNLYYIELRAELKKLYNFTTVQILKFCGGIYNLRCASAKKLNGMFSFAFGINSKNMEGLCPSERRLWVSIEVKRTRLFAVLKYA